MRSMSSNNKVDTYGISAAKDSILDFPTLVNGVHNRKHLHESI